MAKTVFNATKEQLRQMAALAANAALPVGLGLIHFQPDKEYTADDMKRYEDREGIDCDYVDGRCTKLRVWRPYEREYAKKYRYMTGYETQPTYETWFTKYPSYVELLKAAGVTDFLVVGPR
jgi:hypothetical protein